MNTVGLYLHIPFCASKCPYCDFYSFRADESLKDAYTEALIKQIGKSAEEFTCKVNSLYIGGGTPSVLGADRLCRIIETVRRSFVSDEAEITVECNPHALGSDFFKKLSYVGVNRISLGVQSADNGERRLLGRLSDRTEILKVTEDIKKSGISNFSLDVMLGIPNQTEKSLESTLRFCLDIGAKHISGYILKIEEGTVFHKRQSLLNLPDEDTVCDMYLFMCDFLESRGLKQYEISNFACPGFESRHNLKYWNCDEYLGLGPAAHSFINKKRFYYPRDINAFINSPETVPDGEGGGFEEYAMLRLRLCEGITEEGTMEKFGFKIPDSLIKKAARFAEQGLLVCDRRGVRLTKEGFLVSNTVISELIY